MDASTVRELPLFDGLSEEVAEDCARRFEGLELLAGTGLAREGEFAYKFFVVLDGEVEVQRNFRHVATLGPVTSSARWGSCPAADAMPGSSPRRAVAWAG